MSQDTLIYPEETEPEVAPEPVRKPVLKSVVAPEKPKQKGNIRTEPFKANDKNYTVDVDLNLYSTRVVREHSRLSRVAGKIEDEDEREDAEFNAGLDFTVIGAVSTTAPVQLSLEGMLDGNFNVAIGLIEAVQRAVFPSSTDSAE